MPSGASTSAPRPLSGLGPGAALCHLPGSLLPALAPEIFEELLKKVPENPPLSPAHAEGS